MDIVTYALSKKYTNKAIESLVSTGVKYKGSKNSFAELPAPSADNKGDMYTISGVDQPDYGFEYLSDGTQWIALGPDVSKKADLPDELPPELKVPGVDYPWFMVNMDPKSIDADGNLHLDHSGYNFNTKQYYTWSDKVIPMAATTATGGLMTAADKVKVNAALTEHQDISGKLNILPKVDGPTDPGYGWEYHIPYRFDVALDAEKADINLHTLTLDNKLTKMVFNKQIPAASTTMAGLMSAADKVKLNGIVNPSYIELTGWDETSGWHDGGTLTEAQAAILVSNELNYIWMNGMHRLDFRYKDDNNNLATYSANDGTKTHVIEITLNTKAWRYSHTVLQDKLTAGKNITIENNVIKANSEFITLTGTSGTLTDEQLAVINDNVDAFISLNDKQFKFSSVVLRGGIIATYINTTSTDIDSIIVNIGNKSWEYVSTQVQPKLVSGTNIKTINNNSLLGEGNIFVKTYQAFPSEFVTDGTLSQFISSIQSYAPGAGMAYLGAIYDAVCPWGYGNAECKVEYMKDNIALVTVSSSNISPYFWVMNSAEGKWRSFSDVPMMPAANGDYKLHVENGVATWVAI